MTITTKPDWGTNIGDSPQGPVSLAGLFQVFFDDIDLVLNSDAWILNEFTVATVPDAATFKAGVITVSNETGGYTMAFSDGTNWRRVQDRVVIS